jgi:hypothetical protein
VVWDALGTVGQSAAAGTAAAAAAAGLLVRHVDLYITNSWTISGAGFHIIIGVHSQRCFLATCSSTAAAVESQLQPVSAAEAAAAAKAAVGHAVV